MRSTNSPVSDVVQGGEAASGRKKKKPHKTKAGKSVQEIGQVRFFGLLEGRLESSQVYQQDVEAVRGKRKEHESDRVVGWLCDK